MATTSYRLRVAYFPPLKLNFALDLVNEAAPAPEAPSGKRIEIIMGESPDMLQLKMGDPIDVQMMPGPFAPKVRVVFMSYEPDESGLPHGTVQSAPFLSAAVASTKK
jgi:hypothetical protein